jgi:nucleoside-diphosphate-sugar epimerase
MRVVITGAAGFIGRHTMARFAAGGWSVVSVDRRPLTDGHPAPAQHLRADLSRPLPPAVRRELARADAVVHLAGRGGVRAVGAAAGRGWAEDNVGSAWRVLAATPRATPVVVTSSSSVYGRAADRPSAECDKPAPLGGYGRSKLGVEALCHRRRLDGGRVSVARPFTVIGPGQRPDMAIRTWLQAALSGGPVEIYGSRSRARDVTAVDAVAEGLWRLAHLDCDVVVNLGSGIPRRLDEMLAAVVTAVGRPVEVREVALPVAEPDLTWADTRRCAEVLGFVPRTDLAELVASCAAELAGSGQAPTDNRRPVAWS